MFFIFIAALTCQYSDKSNFTSVSVNGLQGPLANLTWSNSTGITPQASFCECASGYLDIYLNGTCYPVYGSNSLALVDPLITSPIPQLVLNANTPSLLNNIFSFQITSPLTLGRNVTWFLSSTAPTLAPNSANTGSGWGLSGTNSPLCSRPGKYDVSSSTSPISSDTITAALDWIFINNGRNADNSGTSVCGFSFNSDASYYYNSAQLTIVSTDLLSNGLTRTSAQSYPMSFKTPKNVSVSSSAITVNSTINLIAISLNQYYNQYNSTLKYILQTSVQFPWQLNINNYTTPTFYSFLNWTLVDNSKCVATTGTCVQLWQLFATPNLSLLCPATLPQSGQLNNNYNINYNISTRDNSNSAVPNSNVNIYLQTGNICNNINIGVSTSVTLNAYNDSALSQPITTQKQGQNIYFAITTSSTQAVITSVRVNQIWFAQNSAVSSITYPSVNSTYPNVRMLYDLQDAQNCNSGSSGYPTSPNSPITSNTTLANCNPFNSGGTGIVQPQWLNAPASTPEYLYSTGQTLLGSNNNFTINHMQFGNSTATFSFGTSLFVTKSAAINSNTQTSANPANYMACQPSNTFADPCQKYLIFQDANTLSTYYYAASITIFYSGFKSQSFIVKRQLSEATSTSLISGQAHIIVDKDAQTSDTPQQQLVDQQLSATITVIVAIFCVLIVIIGIIYCVKQ